MTKIDIRNRRKFRRKIQKIQKINIFIWINKICEKHIKNYRGVHAITVPLHIPRVKNLR